VVRDGGVVALPTDTVWGLVARADDAAAVDRIYAIKGRRAEMELPLLVDALDTLRGLVELSSSARRLAHAHWPGALTLVVPCIRPRSELVIPRRGTTLAVRLPAHEALRALIAATGPLASTSANRHGAAAATSAGDVRDQLGDAVDLIVAEGRSATGGAASTIVDCTVEPWTLIRAGAVDPSP
jgi:L-threonylcarbamoyladenylate synthase